MVSYQRDHFIEYYKQRMLKVVNLRSPKTFAMTWSNSYLLPSQPLNIPPCLMKRYVLCYCCLHLECLTIEFFLPSSLIFPRLSSRIVSLFDNDVLLTPLTMASFIHPLSEKSSMEIKHTDNFITAQFPNSKIGRLSPGAVSILAYTPETPDEALTHSVVTKPPSSYRRTQSPVGKRSYWRSNSKELPMEIFSRQKTGKTPRSQKTSTATILTETGNDQPAFESDAFAVNMPTTREPVEPYTSPSPAQIAAYQHYAEKARRNVFNDYQTEHAAPMAVSYDYAYGDIPFNSHYILELDATPPSSPPTTPPGAFPTSPPEPTFTTSHYNSGSRSISTPRYPIIRKPVGASPSPRQPMEDNKIDHHDTSAGAEHFPPNLPTEAKWRATARAQGHRSDQNLAQNHQQRSDKPWWSLSTRPRRPSPSPFSPKAPKSYTLEEIPGSWRTASGIHSSTPTPPRHRAGSFGLAWLRPSSSRQRHGSDSTSTTYIDPFTLASPPKRKLSRPLGPREESSSRAGSFDEWCESVQRVAKLVAKVCLVVYLAMGAWYVLDAVREIVWVVSWPGRMVWMVCRWIGEACEKFGILGHRRY
jgi:hypothetical protein